MKKTLSIILAFIMAFSVVTVAFAADAVDPYKTCPICGYLVDMTKDDAVEEYNNHLATHNTEEEEEDEEAVREYQCETCKKIYYDVDEYNACVDSHYNNINYHYDKYIDLTLLDVLSQLVDICNQTGIFDFFKEVVTMLYNTLTDYIASSAEA